MNAKLLRFDISKDDTSTLVQQSKIELVSEIETQTNEIMGEFLNEINLFAQITMEQSSAQQQHFLNQWNEQLSDTVLKQYSSDQQIELIEKRIFNITQEKIIAEEEKKVAEEKAKALFNIKEELEIALKKIEIEKSAAEHALLDAEKALSLSKKNVEIDRVRNEILLNQFKSGLDEYIKATELKKSENTLLEESLEKLKNKNADIESQNRILLAEVKIEKRELEFIEKKFFNERTELHQKIEELEKKLDLVTKDAELLQREKMTAEITNIQSQKALENVDALNISLKHQVESKEEIIRNKETELRKIQEKFYQNDVIQVNKIHLLEEKLKKNDEQHLNKIQELENKLSDNVNLVHLIEKEKHELQNLYGETEQRNKILSEEVENLYERIVISSKELQNSSEQVRNLSEQLESASEQVQTLSEQVQSSSEQIQSSSEQIQSLSEQVQSSSEQIQSLSEQVQSSSKQIQSSSEKVVSLSEQVQIEKEALETLKKKAAMESISLNSEIDELKSKLNEAQKQKEILIANKLNNTLQVKRDTYIDKSPYRIKLLKSAFIIVPVFILILSYLIFNHYYSYPNYFSPIIKDELKKEITTLNSELENKSKYINTMTIEHQKLTAKLENLTRQVDVFQNKVDKMPIAPILNNQLIASVYFDSGNSSLNETEIKRIKTVAEKYNGNPYVFIRLEGHTDDKMFRFPIFHQYNNNLDLSIARAAEVSRLLVQYGMDTKQISIVGLSDIYPLVPNDNSENREKNRRVDIKIIESIKQTF